MERCPCRFCNAEEVCDECGRPFSATDDQHEWGKFTICDECLKTHLDCDDPLGSTRGGSMPKGDDEKLLDELADLFEARPAC